MRRRSTHTPHDTNFRRLLPSPAVYNLSTTCLSLLLTRYPKYAEARKVTCEVKAGETLFLPSYWWHEVTTIGDDTPENIAIGINNFFSPVSYK